MCELFALVSYF